MRDLYYTTTNPKHSYKSEGFFENYFWQRERTAFGPGVHFSAYKKSLMLKKFFMWYYFIPTKRFFAKLFTRQYQKQFFTFRALGALFHVLERNVLLLLVRANFCRNLLQALYFVRSGFVFINGQTVNRSFFVTRLGDCIEFFAVSCYFLSFLFNKHLLNFTHLRERYFKNNAVCNYFDGEGDEEDEGRELEVYPLQDYVSLPNDWEYSNIFNYFTANLVDAS